ncbi:MAG: hypothetical protein JKX94_04475, partial [Sneathiella sp.]|nr:hypothetical protein [Sneathiella sp.]
MSQTECWRRPFAYLKITGVPMYPTIIKLDSDCVLFKLHIPDILYQFEGSNDGCFAYSANDSELPDIYEQIDAGKRKFLLSFSIRDKRYERTVNRHIHEFKILSKNLNRMQVPFLCQMFLHQKFFQPEAEQRVAEIKKGLAFYGDLERNKALNAFFLSVLFAVPTDLLRSNVITQIAYMMYQAKWYLTDDQSGDVEEEDKDQKKSALEVLWGRAVIRLMVGQVTAKKKRYAKLTRAELQQVSSWKLFPLFYWHSSDVHFEFFCELVTAFPEPLNAILGSLNNEFNRDDGRFAELADAEKYILIVYALRSLRNNQNASHQSHIENGAIIIKRWRDNFTPLLYLGAMKIRDVPEFKGDVAKHIREALDRCLEQGAYFPDRDQKNE